MSHVDDGTLHAYLDGELSPAEAQGVDAHFAQCSACRGRLEEERALITRAGELLALAAPPDREVPPFRVGDAKPPTRLWWQVRLGLAWAATVAIALGIGTYLGRGGEPAPGAPTASDTQPAEFHALLAPLSSDTARRESRDKARGTARTPPAARPATHTPAPVAQRIPDTVVARSDTTAAGLAYGERERAESQSRVFRRTTLEDARDSWRKGSAISIDSARRVLGADPLVVPGVPIEAIYRAREIGYSAVVIIEQALDSNTVIEVVNRRESPVALEEVVVTGAGAVAARPDSASATERARVGRARVADSLAAAPAAKASARPLRRLGGLDVRVSGPLPSDSLQKLLRLVQPVKP
ncbi:MAG TPA: zf-HC2 domain-containing protein [Gemmatimonadales bacterium]